MSAQAKPCPTIVLSDSPSGEDAFSHSRVANAIADLILSTEGGKSIGLTGSWGSGKSSVIELLRARLRNESNATTDTFVFDAWAHQGDPLRRTFLEQLTDHLSEIGWLHSQDIWSEKKEVLARRLQRVTTKTRPVLTAFGAWFAILILLTPVGLQLFSKYDAKNFNHPKLALVGVTVALLPFLFGVCSYLYLRPTWRFWQERFWFENRGKYKDDNLLALFLNRTQEHSDSTTIRTPDPTSLEFQFFFGELLDDALGDKNRRLIIVVDNLDRVNAEDALAIWATMKTFFEIRARHKSTWTTRMWLIVPFDHSALKKLWPEKVTTELASNPYDGLADSFADKTFQLTFRVSPPLLSDWRQFFENQLRTAFPGNHEADIHTIYRLYDLKRLGASRPPTPRDIKLFINAVGALHRQWQHEIPLHLQSLYVLLSKQYSQLELELATKADKDILAPVPVQLVGLDWRQNVAAIHFNVPVQEALEVALGGTVRSALVESDVNELQRLSEINGFENVLERVVEGEYGHWADTDPTKLAGAATSLAQTSKDGSALEESWRWLKFGAMLTKDWGQLNSTVAIGLVQLISRYKDVELVKALCRSVPASLFEKDKLRSAENLRSSTASFVNVVRSMNQIQPHVVAEFLLIPGLASDYLDILAGVSSSGTEANDILTLLRPAAAREDVVQVLAAMVPSGTFKREQFEILQILVRIDKTWPWKTLIVACDARLRGTQQLPVDENRALSELLLYLSAHDQHAADSVKTLAETGFLANHLWYAASGSDKHAQAVLVMEIIDHIHAFSLPSAPWQAGNGMSTFRTIVQNPGADPQILEAIASITLALRRFKQLYEIRRQFGEARTYVSQVLSKVAELPGALEVVSPKDIVEEYSLYSESLGSRINDLIRVAADHSRLAQTVSEYEFNTALAGLYIKVFTQGGRDRGFTDYLVSELRLLQKDTWESQLAQEGEVVELALRLQRDLPPDSELGLGPAFGDALEGHCEKLLSGGVSVARLRDLWSDILNVLSPPSRAGFLFRLAGMICDSQVSTDPLLQLYGNALRDSFELLSHVDRLGFQAAPRMFERRVPGELKWLIEVLKRNDVRDRFPAAARSEMIDRIKNTDLDTFDEESHQLANVLKEVLQSY